MASKQSSHAFALRSLSPDRHSIRFGAGPFKEFVSDLRQPRADDGIGDSGGKPIRFLGEFEETIIAMIGGLQCHTPM
jgi:hypothetical protein